MRSRFLESLLYSFREFRRSWTRFWVGLGQGIAHFFGDTFEGVRSFPEAVAGFFRLIGRILLAILLLPWTILKAIGRGIRSLASLPTAAKELAEDQRRALERSAKTASVSMAERPKDVARGVRSWFSNLGLKFSRQPIWLKSIYVVFLVGLVAGLASIPFAKSVINEWRVDNLIAEAETLYSEGREMEAFRKTQAAHYINMENMETLRSLVEYGSAIGTPRTVEYSRRLADQPDATAEDLLDFVEAAQQYNRAELAAPYLARIRDLDPDNPALPVLEIRNLLALERLPQAFARAQEAVESGNRQPEILRLYGTLGIRSNRAETISATKSVLTGIAENEEGEAATTALLVLLRWPDLEEDEVRQWVDRIVSSEDSEPLEKLAAYAAEVRQGLATIDERMPTMKAIAEDAFTPAEFAAWLVSNGQREAMLTRTTREEVLGSRELFMLYTMALIQEDRGEEALTWLSNPAEIPVEEIDRLILRARALQQLQREDAYRATVEQAIAEAEPRDYNRLIQLVRSLGDTQFLVPLYQTIAREPQTAQFGQGRLLLHSYALGEEEVLEETLQRLRIDRFRDNPAVQSLIGYLDGLRNARVSQNVPELERIVAENPTVLDYQVSLALSYFRLGRYEEARAILSRVVRDELRPLTGFFVTGRTILERIGAEAPEMGDINSERLIDLERAFTQEPAPETAALSGANPTS